MTALIPIEIWASVGGGDHIFIETVAAPVTAKGNEKGGDEELVIDLTRQLRRLREAMAYYRPEDPE